MMPLQPVQAKHVQIMVDTLSIQPASGGIRVYLRELIRHSPGHSATYTLICSRTNASAFADLPVRIVRIPLQTRSRILRIFIQQFVVPLVVARHRPDVYFAPVDIAALAVPVPIVTCVHSSHLNVRFGYQTLIKSIYNKIFLSGTIRRSRAIIAISEYVARETAGLFPAAAGKTSVVYHGGGLVEEALSSGWIPPESAERRGGILFVGTLHPHKRVDALLNAYKVLLRRYPDRMPDLVIVGHDAVGEKPRLQSIAKDLGISGRIKFMGRSSDEELLELYSHSQLLVIPSAVEGFGLPVIEAMQAGLPVVVSNRCALPEIGGDACLVIDPDDVDGTASAMAEALWEPKTRARMIKRGLARGSQFAWRRCAEKTVAVLHGARNI